MRLVLASLLALAALPAAAAQPVKLVYAMPVTVPAVIPYIALDKGFFKAEGLDVEAKMFSSGREALQALLSGQAQLQSVSETPIVHAILQGNRVAVIATAARHKEAKLLARKDRGIAGPADLAGKRVATLPGTNSDYFMYKFMAAHGLEGKLKVANMPPPEMVLAYVKGDIDAYFAWEPHISYGMGQLPEQSLLIGSGDLYSGWLTVNMDPDYVAKNPEVARKVVRALLKAEDWTRKHEDEAVTHVAARLKLDEKIMRRLWSELDLRVELDKGLVPQMLDIGRWAQGLQKSDKPLPDFRQYIHDEALRKEKPRAVSL